MSRASFLAGLLALSATADAATFLIAFGVWGIAFEANPLVRALVEQHGVWAVLPLKALSVLPMVLVVVLWATRSRAITALAIGGALVGFFGALSNLHAIGAI